MFRNKALVIGFLLVLFGFIAPFLMVLDVIPSSFWLSFLSHGASVSGLFLGLIGVSTYIQANKKKETDY
jgi:hypothetical protein